MKFLIFTKCGIFELLNTLKIQESQPDSKIVNKKKRGRHFKSPSEPICLDNEPR